MFSILDLRNEVRGQKLVTKSILAREREEDRCRQVFRLEIIKCFDSQRHVYQVILNIEEQFETHFVMECHTFCLSVWQWVTKREILGGVATVYRRTHPPESLLEFLNSENYCSSWLVHINDICAKYILIQKSCPASESCNPGAVDLNHRAWSPTSGDSWCSALWR